MLIKFEIKIELPIIRLGSLFERPEQVLDAVRGDDAFFILHSFSVPSAAPTPPHVAAGTRLRRSCYTSPPPSAVGPR